MTRLHPCLLALLLFACAAPPADDGGRDARTLAQKKAEDLLQGFDERLAALRARAQSGAAHAKEDVHRSMAELEEKKTTVQLKLEKLRSAGRESVRRRAEEVDQAVDDLDRGFREAASRFR